MTIVIVPAPNNNDPPNASVDNDEVLVATVASAMRRNTTLPSSTWTAA